MAEFAWWAAYDALEPLAPPSAEQVALIAATMVNMQITRGPRTHIEDFLPGYERQPLKPQSPQEIERNLLMTLGLN